MPILDKLAKSAKLSGDEATGAQKLVAEAVDTVLAKAGFHAHRDEISRLESVGTYLQQIMQSKSVGGLKPIEHQQFPEPVSVKLSYFWSGHRMAERDAQVTSVKTFPGDIKVYENPDGIGEHWDHATRFTTTHVDNNRESFGLFEWNKAKVWTEGPVVGGKTTAVFTANDMTAYLNPSGIFGEASERTVLTQMRALPMRLFAADVRAAVVKSPAELDERVSQIVSKYGYKQDPRLEEALHAIDPADRKIADAVVDASASGLNGEHLMTSMRQAQRQVESLRLSPEKTVRPRFAQANDDENWMTYLFAKSNSLQHKGGQLYSLAEVLGKTPHPAFLFGDASKVPQADLADLMRTKMPLFSFDPGFDRGLNVIDITANHVGEKLQDIVDRVKAHPRFGSTPIGSLVDDVLHGESRNAAQRIGATIINGEGETATKITAQNVRDYFERSHLYGDDRLFAARSMANDVDYINMQGFADRLLTLHNLTDAQLKHGVSRTTGLSTPTYYLVGDGSARIVNRFLQGVADIPPSSFVRELGTLHRSGALERANVVLADDIAHSGDQRRARWANQVRQYVHPTSNRVVLANIAQYEQAARAVPKSKNVRVVSLETPRPLSPAHDSQRLGTAVGGRTAEANNSPDAVKEWQQFQRFYNHNVGTPHGEFGSRTIPFYMMPDTVPEYVRDFFGELVQVRRFESKSSLFEQHRWSF